MYEDNLEEVRKAALAAGKEPFDYRKFAAVYPHDTGSCERLKGDEPKAVQDQYEWEYYVSYREAMTVEEYAEMRDRIDESY